MKRQKEISEASHEFTKRTQELVCFQQTSVAYVVTERKTRQPLLCPLTAHAIDSRGQKPRTIVASIGRWQPC
jgi:hypothetical protein